MGLLIKVQHVLLGDVAVFDTDRSLSGQDGETFHDANQAATAQTFPARLAVDLFAALPDLESVYVYSNTVSLRRHGDWTQAQATVAAQVIGDSLVFYDENKSSAHSPATDSD